MSASSRKAPPGRTRSRWRVLILGSCFLCMVVSAVARPVNVHADDIHGEFMMGGGVGGLTCPAYVQLREKMRAGPSDSLTVFNSMARFTMFIEGYRTSYNELTDDTFDIFGGLEDDQLLAWTENWCRQNPLQKWASAVVALAREQYPHRQRSRY